MTLASFLLFSAFVGLVSTDPQILWLYKFPTGGSFSVDGVENGAKLYVASNDNMSALKNITITSGSFSTTLDKLSDYYDDGTPKYINITGGLTVKTVNSDSQTSALSGYIYVTTYQQAHDPTFGVYVITDKQRISRDGMKTTTVVLNTALVQISQDLDKPPMSSYVTNIDHSSNTNLYFMWGVPTANWYDAVNNTFFENPLNFNDYNEDTKQWTTTRVFFDHVEPLQIGLRYWYFMSMGPVNMDVESKYVSEHNYTTTAVNTTGLIVNDQWFFKDHQINYLQDPTRNRTVGTLISTFLNYPVTFLLDGDTAIVSQTYGNGGNVIHALGETYFQASRLLVNSTNIYPGTFYCQYYGFSTNLLPVTNAPSTVPTTMGPTTSRPMITTPTVATTTKSSQTHTFIEMLMLFVATVLIR